VVCATGAGAWPVLFAVAAPGVRMRLAKFVLRSLAIAIFPAGADSRTLSMFAHSAGSVDLYAFREQFAAGEQWFTIGFVIEPERVDAGDARIAHARTFPLSVPVELSGCVG